MSFRADDNAGYFETVQLYFTELTRRSMFLSGRDLELLDEWRDRGATATAICKGLRDAVEAMPGSDPPRDVHACRRYIEPYVKRAEKRSVGANDREVDRSRSTARAGAGDRDRAETSDGTEEDVVERALERIERAGRRAEDERVTQAYRKAWRRVRELLGAEDAGERLGGLAAIEEGLVDDYFRALDRDEREAIDSRVTSGDSSMLERMSPEARRQHLRARRRRILIEEYGLISIIDYSDERATHE